MADDLEKAIIQAYDPMSSPQARESAMDYLSSISASAGGWRTFMEKLFGTSDIQVALVCISALSEVVLHRYLALTVDEHSELKQGLLTFIQQIIGPGTPPLLETQVALLLVHVFKVDFPHEWPTFFADLATATLTTPSGLTASRENPMSHEDANSLPSPDGIRLWLRVLSTIDEEVVSNDVNRSIADTAHSSVLKDAMREIAVLDMVETWYNLLVCFHEQNTAVTDQTLSVMNSYIGWIDIELVLNERFLPLLFKLATIPEYCGSTMETFTAFLDKGMDRDPRQKLELMQTLQLPRILSQVAAVDETTMEKIAALVNCMGVEILECYRLIGDAIAAEPELNKASSELLQCALEALFKYYNDDIDDTSRALVNFARNYLQFVRKVRKMNEGVLSPEMLEHLKILIQIIHKKMRYDESFNFDDLALEEDEFTDFRKTLGDQFKQITKMEPDIVFEYVGQLISHIGEMNDPLDMEVALRCLWLMGEGFVDAANPTAGPGPFFIAMFRLLIESKIFNYEEPRALMSQFFECVSRYSKLFTHAQELITPLLDLWMGKHGVLHPHAPTRASRCTLFTQFVKNLKAPLQGFLLDIVQHLQEHATFRPDSFDHVTYHEQIELFETFGVLIGYDRNDNTKHKEYIDLLVLPLVENMQNIIDQKLYLNDAPHNMFHTKWLSYLIRGVGTFSKGFPLPIIQSGNTRRQNTAAEATEAMIFFAKVFDLVMQIMSVLGNKDEIRSACVFYFQRMAVCLSSSYLLPFLPVVTERLLTPLTVSNMNEYAMLLIKLVGTYTNEVGEHLDGQLFTIITKVNELIAHLEMTVTPQSDEERDLVEMKRQYFCFLWTLAANHLGALFISAANIANLQVILDSLLSGCSTFSDPVTQKHSFGTLAILTKEWLGEGHGPAEGLPEGFADTFLNWLYQAVLPAAFEVPVSPKFNLGDAKSSEALQEMAQLERNIAAAVGAGFDQFLTSMLPATSLQCTPEVIAQYLEGLRAQSTAKQWKKFKSEFIAYHKKER